MNSSLLKLIVVVLLDIAWFGFQPETAWAESYAYDPAGRLSAVTLPNRQVFYYQYDLAGNLSQVVTNVVDPVAITGTVVREVGMAADLDFTGGNPMGAHTYYAYGLPAGLQIDPVTGRVVGQISAAPGSYLVHYWAVAGTQVSKVQTVTITVQSFPAVLAGVYDALLTDPATGNPAGRIEIGVSALGGYSARLLHEDGGTYGLYGSLLVNKAGDAASASYTVSRGPYYAPLVVNLTVGGSDTVSGGVVVNQQAVSGVSIARRRAAFSTQQPAPWQGVYTMLLQPAAYMPNTPEGSGYASVGIASTGYMTLYGKNPDGSVLYGVVPSGADGTYLIYLRPPILGSYLGGSLLVQPSGGHYGITPGPNSRLISAKGVSPSDVAYQAGFGPVALLPTMQAWIAPSATSTLPQLLGLPASGSFGATIQGANLDNTGGSAGGGGGGSSAPFGSDAFASRTVFPVGGGAAMGSNAGASKEVNEPNHAGNAGGHSIWWQWTPLVGGSVTINTVNSTFDTVLAVYTGTTVGGLTAVASDDDSGGSGTSLLTFNAVAGTTYQVAVDGYGGATGTINLLIAPSGSAQTGPANTYGIPAWLRLTLSNRSPPMSRR